MKLFSVEAEKNCNNISRFILMYKVAISWIKSYLYKVTVFWYEIKRSCVMMGH